jgi:hypothetical protein
MHDAGSADGASLHATERPNSSGRGNVCVSVHCCQVHVAVQVALACRQPIAQVWGRGSVITCD